MKTPKAKTIQFNMLNESDRYNTPSYQPTTKKSAINLTHQRNLPFHIDNTAIMALSTDSSAIKTTKTFHKTSHLKLKPLAIGNSNSNTINNNSSNSSNHSKLFKSKLYTRKCSDNVTQMNHFNTINTSINNNTLPNAGAIAVRKTASFKHNRINIECKENNKNEYIKHFSTFIDHHTQAGQKTSNELKTNQDNYITLASIFNVQYFDVIGVFDGHGREGHLVSEYIKKYFTDYFADKKRFFGKKDPSLLLCPNPQFIYKHLTSNNNKVITHCFDNLEKEIEHSKIETEFSGATCDVVIRIVRKLLILNVGDSRSILVYKSKLTKEYITEQLTTDHNPMIVEEKERIIAKNGEIHPYSDDINCNSNPPLRVWVSGENYPGIAITRSIGDVIAKKIGVVHTPEIRERLLKGNECFLITASDGVWEYLDNEKVKDIVLPYYISGSYKGAANALVNEAMRMWSEHGEKRDDITCVIYFFEDMFSI